MIIVRELGIEIGGRRLLDPISFTIGNGEKVGLVGRNGAGKSTLLSVLLGGHPEHLRVSGTVTHQGSLSHLPQEPVPGGLGVEPIGLSHVLSARGLDSLDADMQHARHALAADPTEETIARFTSLEEEFREKGGYEAESEVARLADGLGLEEELLLEDLNSLSGGQRRRVDLMRVLYEEPATMVLDEPTNHLDKAAKRWLFDELERFRGTVLVISHDLPLLDRAIDRVLALRDGQLREYKGNYSKFLQLEEERRLSEEKIAVTQDAKIDQLSKLADSMRGQTAKRARLAKVLDRRVEKLEDNRIEVTRKERKVTFRLPEPPRSGDVPMTVEHVSVRYGALEVLRDANFITRRGDRIVIVGRNGAGKSSLLRCLAGAQSPDGGSVRFGANVTVGYFAQENEQLDFTKTVLGNLDGSTVVTEVQRRSMLGAFGLKGDAAYQMPATLSGGERAKLALAILASSNANLLLLDEPTNNLDPASVLALGEMMRQWKGTVVAVSHERGFVEALEPTHAVLLPEEYFDLWDEEYMDLIEQR
ncbi:MAG TPA: ABC-F family ATP-binding cassette domain-containing protein [Acidimicrobiales bacterium]|nr:ABC-F family ATP-binding cassette domain-containing protein [Acidimicrobiales bacterium]